MLKRFMTCCAAVAVALLAASLTACCPAISPSAGQGLAKIGSAMDMAAVYAIKGGSFDPAVAGWSADSWNQDACIGALQMYEVMVAYHEVGAPTIAAVSAGETVDPPGPREPPNYEATCKEIQDAGPP